MKTCLDVKGGSGLLLHYLKNFDLSGIDVNDAPKTQGLLEQKERNLTPIQQWWLECLTQARIAGSDLEATWPAEAVDKDRIREAATRYIKERAIMKGYYPNEARISKELKIFCPSTGSSRKMRDGVSHNVYNFPTLEVARAEWEHHIGHKVEWL
jgi:hypothetical protein